MKKIKKILLVIMSVLLIIPANVSATESEVNNIINFANSKLYSSAYSGYCQRFVREAYEAAGISGTAGSATEARKKWLVSKDLSNIPVGACIYFTSNHVAIYSGNDTIIHTASGYYGNSSISYVVKTSLSERINKGEVAGWGYQGGYNLYREDSNNPVKTSFPLVNNGIYKIRNVNSGKVLEVPGASMTSGVQVQQATDVGGAHQLWKAVQHGDGYSFVAVHSGMAMDLYGASGENGAKITQCGYHGKHNQRFKLVDRGGGRYSMHPVTSDLAMDVYGSSTNDGTQIYQYAYHGDVNQLFTFELVDTVAPTISNVRITDVSKDGYTVHCDVTDDIGVGRVLFISWAEANGADDTDADAGNNYNNNVGSCQGSTYSFRVKTSDHNNENGTYITNIDAYDMAWNRSSYMISATVDTIAPTIENIRILDVTRDGYTVYCDVSDNTAIERVVFPTWTVANNQDDIKADWYNTTAVWTPVGGNTYSYRVNCSEHNSEMGDYITHIYAYDTHGNHAFGDAGIIAVSNKDSEDEQNTETTTPPEKEENTQITTPPENGWYNGNGTKYWYENGIRQGTYDDPNGVLGDGTVRGREIYDPESDGWYWLDAIYDGAKAVNKEVWMPYIYQNEAEWDFEEIAANALASGDMAEQVIREINNRSGKWVRYDANGKMYKGWYTVEGDDAQIYPEQAGNTYYYDQQTGLMAKGEVNIEGQTYYFDEITGVLRK